MTTLANETMTLGRIVSDNALRYPDLPAYQADSESLTHSELYRRAVRLASAMACGGVAHEDRVAILGRNSLRFGEVLAATQLSGVVLAPVNFRLSPAEVLDAFAGGSVGGVL